MKAELTTMVMIENPATKEVLVQNRKLKWQGYSFPGGKVEPGENFYDCAVREIKEETGLTATDLISCGVVHWCNTDTDERYIVFLYKTNSYSGTLIPDSPEGDHFWCSAEKLKEMPRDKFSNEFLSYCHLYFGENFNEVFIPWHTDEKTGKQQAEVFFK